MDNKLDKKLEDDGYVMVEGPPRLAQARPPAEPPNGGAGPGAAAAAAAGRVKQEDAGPSSLTKGPQGSGMSDSHSRARGQGGGQSDEGPGPERPVGGNPGAAGGGDEAEVGQAGAGANVAGGGQPQGMSSALPAQQPQQPQPQQDLEQGALPAPNAPQAAMQIEWRPCPPAPAFEVNIHGEFRSSEKIVKVSRKASGCSTQYLERAGPNGERLPVPNLVALAWLPDAAGRLRADGTQKVRAPGVWYVHHLDGNRSNNAASNLCVRLEPPKQKPDSAGGQGATAAAAEGSGDHQRAERTPGAVPPSKRQRLDGPQTRSRASSGGQGGRGAVPGAAQGEGAGPSGQRSPLAEEGVAATGALVGDMDPDQPGGSQPRPPPQPPQPQPQQQLQPQPAPNLVPQPVPTEQERNGTGVPPPAPPLQQQHQQRHQQQHQQQQQTEGPPQQVPVKQEQQGAGLSSLAAPLQQQQQQQQPQQGAGLPPPAAPLQQQQQQPQRGSSMSSLAAPLQQQQQPQQGADLPPPAAPLQQQQHQQPQQGAGLPPPAAPLQQQQQPPAARLSSDNANLLSTHVVEFAGNLGMEDKFLEVWLETMNEVLSDYDPNTTLGGIVSSSLRTLTSRHPTKKLLVLILNNIRRAMGLPPLSFDAEA